MASIVVTGVFDAEHAGFVPASGGGTTNFLRADGSWVAAGGGGSLSDGDKGDVTVTGSGATWTIDNGVVTTAKMGGDVTTAGKALLDDADAAAQRATLGLGSAATQASSAFETAGGVATHAALTSGVHGISAFCATLLDDADAAAARTTLGLAAIAASGSASDLGSGSIPAARIASGTITLPMLANIATARFLGRTTAGAGAPEEMTSAQATALLDAFTSVLKGLVPASGGGTSNFLRADGTWAAPGGGSDPWTYVVLGSDFATTLATQQAVTGFSFTPAINSIYVVEGMFFLRTATATVGPRPGHSWPANLADGVSTVDAASAAATRVLANGNISAAMANANTGVPNTTASWPATLWATMVTGPSTSGNFQITLASETAGTSVTMRARSWIRYRAIA